MVLVHRGSMTWLVAQAALLAVLAATVGVGGVGWAVGLASAVTLDLLLSRGLARSDADRLGPANRVTLVRASLACGVAALTADAFTRVPSVAALVALVTLAAVALALDLVDGAVARRTGSVSTLGARFDMESDAFLILVLSIHVSRSLGAWVLVIGLARYAFVVAGWLLPWMRGALPPRHWRKVVAATQGVVLVAVASTLVPQPAALAAVAGAAVLLAESFGRDVLWLWAHRQHTVGSRPSIGAVPGPEGPPRHRGRVVLARAVTVLALVLVWVALTAPDDPGRLVPVAFLRVPLEGLLLIGLLLVLPRRLSGLAAVLCGTLLAALTIVRVTNAGFVLAIGRPFDPLADWGYFRSAFGLLVDSVGRVEAALAVVAAVTLAVALLVTLPLAVHRLGRVADRHRKGSIRVVVVLSAVWVAGSVLGLQVAPGTAVASTSAAGLAYDEVARVRAEVTDEQAFTRALSTDGYGSTPGRALLTALRGKDVLVVFVESYGRSAIEDPVLSPQIVPVLDAGTGRLRAAGFDSRSAFLTSPTFGGTSWLAHSTLQSGVWVDSQSRYDKLMATRRLTLAGAFHRAGWRTVGDVPSNTQDWPQGAFYGYDTIYDRHEVGYAGPTFGYSAMPDQFVLAAFRRLELVSAAHTPVMAEIDLSSSHAPWAPLPRPVDWAGLGDGSVFDGMPAQGRSAADVWRDPASVRQAYAQSVAYSLGTIVSWLQTYPDPNLVLVVLGDHQPARSASGPAANHDVPVTVIAHDPAVLARLAPWGWQEGLRPGPTAPVWRMDTFRDRFLTTFGTASASGR